MSHIIKHIVVIIILAIAGFSLPLESHAQERQSNEALEQQVKSILEKYVYLSGQIRPNIQPDPARPFIQLFYNPRVQVFDDLHTSPVEEMIAVRDYSERVKSIFPEGLTSSIDLDNIKIGDIPELTDDRILIEIKTRKSVSGVLEGQEYRHTQKVIFIIGFSIEDGEYRNFLIHGITPIAQHDHDLIFSLSPSYSRIINNDLMSDSRFDILWETSWRSGIQYQYMFNNSLGLGLGLTGAISKHRFHLDKFDSFQGHDPHMVDVEWVGKIYYLEIPLYAVFQKQLSKRLSLSANVGGYAGYRVFEDFQSSARNLYSGEELTGVISDPLKYQNISGTDVGILAGIGLRFAFSNRLALIAQTGYRQGILPLQKDVGSNFSYNKYQGQYNPIFNSESSSLSQALTGKIGLSFRLFGENYLN